MDADAIAKDDIEDCSENEGDTAPASMPQPSATLTPPGIAERFASYLDAKVSENGEHPDFTESDALQSKTDVKTLEGELDGWLGPSSKAETIHAEDPVDPLAEADPFPEEVHVNNDGSITGGPAGGNDFEDWKEEALKLNSDASAGAAAMAEAAPAEESVSDAEEADDQMPGEPPLPEEAWQGRPAAERELWERVRPRALRREAARVRELKLPTAAVNRLMRVHPDLQTKSSDTTEIINNATVLLLQALSQATVRGRKAAGHVVKLEDVKQVCLNNRELQFLLPLSATIDASALAIPRHEADDETSRNAGSSRVVPAAPGQSTLSSGAFAQAAQTDLKHGDVDALDVVTVHGNLEQKDKTPQESKSSKRKAPPSTKKGASKVPRQSTTEKASAKLGGGPGIASFFKKNEAS